MTSRRVSFLLLAALGALVAHQFGYAIADAIDVSVGAVDHDYLGTVASFVVAGGIAALVWIAVRREHLSIRSSSRSALAALSGTQVVIFTTQELIEAGASGEPLAAFSRPAVLIGLCLQPIVAWVLLRSAAVGQCFAEFIERSGAVRWQRSVGPLASSAPQAQIGLGQTECPPPRLRGPPRRASV